MTILEHRVQQLLECLPLLAMLCTWTVSHAGDKASTVGSRSSLQIVCAPDQPLVHAGESVILRAWVTDASGKPLTRRVQFTWSPSIGGIAGSDKVTTWTFGRKVAGSLDVIEASATVTAQDDTAGRSDCRLRVYVEKPIELPESTTAPQRSATLSARALLLPDQDEPEPGYGLYSFLLFEAPPNGNEERQRYLKAIEGYLLVLQPLVEMERHRKRSELNLTLLPVKSNIQLPNDLSDSKQAEQAAQRVLAAYDYARAQVLLADFGDGIAHSGPYLVSVTPDGVGNRRVLLSFDMSHVMPQLVWDWVRAFCALTAQENSWTDVTLTKLALNTRNVIAVGARATPEVISGLDHWIRVAKAN